MGTRDFSGDDVIRVLCNSGPFHVASIVGSHAKLRWEPPPDHDSSPRTVIVPRHSRIRLGTLRSIADQAGARDFDEFCRWIDRNR